MLAWALHVQLTQVTQHNAAPCQLTLYCMNTTNRPNSNWRYLVDKRLDPEFVKKGSENVVSLVSATLLWDKIRKQGVSLGLSPYFLIVYIYLLPDPFQSPQYKTKRLKFREGRMWICTYQHIFSTLFASVGCNCDSEMCLEFFSTNTT